MADILPKKPFAGADELNDELDDGAAVSVARRRGIPSVAANAPRDGAALVVAVVVVSDRGRGRDDAYAAISAYPVLRSVV